MSFWYHRTVSSSVKFESLKIGDFFDGDKIVDIDHKLGVVVVLYSSDLYYFWISNPDDRLSLYHNSYGETHKCRTSKNNHSY